MTNLKRSILEYDKIQLEYLTHILRKADTYFTNIISDKSLNLSHLLTNVSSFSTAANPEIGLIMVAEYLKMIYESLAAYPDEKKINWFRENHGFNQEELQWFISIDELLQKVNELNSMNNAILLPSDVVLTVYFEYLPWKIATELTRKFGFTKEYDGQVRPIVWIEFFKFFQNMKNRMGKGNNVEKTELDSFVNSLVNSIEIHPSDQAQGLTPEKILKNYACGMVDSLSIVPLYHRYRNLDKGVSETEKLKAIFDLFRFIMKDRKWQSEAEFEARIRKPYDGVYDLYKAARVRKFIYKK